MSLGVCRSDELEAQNTLRVMGQQFCQIMATRPKPKGLPPYIQPPRNSTRWFPKGNLVIPVAPAGVDQLVFSDRIPLGYDGVLMTVTNSWNGSGFVEASGDITWRIKKDRIFIPYYDTITSTLGSLSVPVDVVGQGIALFSGQLLQYYANFQAGSEARLNVGGKTVCALQGFIWPRERVN
jgi:hypothetical protein